MRTISLQITPFVETDLGFHRIVQRPCKDGDTPMLNKCQICDGTGTLPRGESCRFCGGKGQAKTIWVSRFDINLDNEEAVNQVSSILDSIDRSSHRWQLTIPLVESGGGLTNTGRATIICGIQGEKLRSFYGEPVCGGIHAHFWPHAALSVSYGHHRGNGGGTVSLVAIDRKVRHNLGVEVVDLYSFSDENIEVLSPQRCKNIPFPCAAVEAAKAKARCYHCRSAFYAEGVYARGSSGAR